jgi:hypothetical protein
MRFMPGMFRLSSMSGMTGVWRGLSARTVALMVFPFCGGLLFLLMLRVLGGTVLRVIGVILLRSRSADGQTGRKRPAQASAYQ